MGVTSINVTRVSSNLKTYSLLESLRRNTLGLFQEQNRLATGNRLNAPSDDPVSASRALQLTEILERQEQVLGNIQHANTFLTATDASIGEVNDLLTQAHSIASEMVNTTADQSQRDSMSELIRGIIDQLVTVGNRAYNGVQLFGGQKTLTPPFTQTTGGVEYGGDTAALTAHVDYQQDTAINLNGAELFGSLTARVSGYVDLDPAITDETRLVDLNGAVNAGVNASVVRVVMDNPATSFTVDLSTAETVGDVIDMLNGAAANAGLTVGAGGQFNASINPAQNGLQLSAGAGNVSVQEVGNGITARDLGILSGPAATISGGDVNAKVMLTTRIDSLFGGAGANLGSIQISNGNTSSTIDLSGAETIEDVLNLINGAGVNVTASINAAATGIDIVSRVSGAAMSVGEAGGDTAALLGIRSLYGGTKLSSLNDGDGVTVRDGMTDFRIIARDGSTVDVSLDGARTITDVLDAINTAAAGAGVAVQATLAATGNGIRIVDSTGGAGTLRVQTLNGSASASDLGLLGSAAAGSDELVGSDVNGLKADSVFSALMDLYDALTTGDGSTQQEAAITRAAERIRDFIDHTNTMQGVVGARSQAMNTRLNMTEDAVLATQSLLSEVKDLDYTQAITQFQQAQTALQANLQTGPRLMQLSLLDFIS